MALFTGKGDDGKTSFLGDKTRYGKDSLRAEALGSLDEVNSHIGLFKAKSRQEHFQFNIRHSHILKNVRMSKTEQVVSIHEILGEIQQNLFIVQAELAGSDKFITKEKFDVLSELINFIETQMPPIKTFFVPGATELSAQFDIARTVARRAERAVIRAKGERALSEWSQAYLNRLSSILYALARLSAHQSGTEEEKPTYQ